MFKKLLEKFKGLSYKSVLKDFHVCTWFDVPVYINWSLILILGIMTFVNLQAALMFGSALFFILLHEFGHVLMAKRLGYVCKSVTLYIVGGLARIEGFDTKPKPIDELLITLAGPSVNAVFCLPLLMGNLPSLLQSFCMLNLALLSFNMLFLYPMDGGRILRSLLSLFLKDHDKATIIATKISIFFCALLSIVGFATGMFTLAIIMTIIGFAAHSELSLIRRNQYAEKLDSEMSRVKTMFSEFVRTNNIDEEKLKEVIEKIDRESTKASAEGALKLIKAIKEAEKKQNG